MSKRDDYIAFISEFKTIAPTITEEQRKGLLRYAVQQHGFSVDDADEILNTSGLVIGGKVDYFDVLGFSIEDLQNQNESNIVSQVDDAHNRLYKESLNAGARVRPDGSTEEQWRGLLNQARDILKDSQKRQAHILMLQTDVLPFPGTLSALELSTSDQTVSCDAIKIATSENIRQHTFSQVGQRWSFFGPTVLVGICGLIPLVYLIVEAFNVQGSVLMENLFRMRTAKLFFNTLLLTLGVLVLDILLMTPAAWLTSHSDLRGKRIFSVLCTLPLAIPGYVVALALLGLGGNNGIFAALFGKSIPRLSGYWGALIALSFYTSPYLFLNLRTALQGLDPNLEESARSLGYRQWGVFYRVILPQLRPAYYAAGMLICLHVVGDFGVVSLMRFETFSQALYVEYNVAFDYNYAAWLGLILLSVTCCMLIFEARLLSAVTLHRAGHGVSRSRSAISLRKWSSAGYLYLGLLFIATGGIPTTTVCLWMFRGFNALALGDLLESLIGSLGVAIPTAVCSAVLAVPFAYVSVRYSGRFSSILARTPYIIYAIPPLALGLSIIFCLGSSTTIIVLICACILHFLAEATGPVRSSIYQTSPHIEEAARSLGCSNFQAFCRTLLPLLSRGMLISTAFVFLATMKELPLTLLLRPPGYETLAANVWDYTSEAMFAEAALNAFVILLFSAIFVRFLVRKEGV